MRCQTHRANKTHADQPGRTKHTELTQVPAATTRNEPRRLAPLMSRWTMLLA